MSASGVGARSQHVPYFNPKDLALVTQIAPTPHSFTNITRSVPLFTAQTPPNGKVTTLPSDHHLYLESSTLSSASQYQSRDALTQFMVPYL